MNSTITAVATASGRGAIAVIRVSGPKSKQLYKSLTKTKLSPKPNQLVPSWIYSKNQRIDQSMIVYMQAPRSFTGEDMVEIHCHGSQVVQNKILKTLFSFGVEAAKPGEFSERAYYNGKIDITQAEAIMELVSAENTQVAKLATRQLAGEFSNNINSLRTKLVKLSAQLAADLDFSEEDLPTITKSAIAKVITETIKDINIISANSELLPKLREGIHVALVGLPNAGKSTLLNTLLGYDRSIVTEIAGTTRDTVSESVEIDGISYHFTDTAGLNTDPDEVEAIGIERTISAISGADIVMLLIQPGEADATKQFIANNNLADPLKLTKLITVFTKSDLAKTRSNNLLISAKHNTGIGDLINELKNKSDVQLASNINILTDRQLKILTSTQVNLVKLSDNLSGLTNDIISAELESVITDLNELTGEQASKQVIDSIFRNFCIGK